MTEAITLMGSAHLKCNCWQSSTYDYEGTMKILHLHIFHWHESSFPAFQIHSARKSLVVKVLLSSLIADIGKKGNYWRFSLVLQLCLYIIRLPVNMKISSIHSLEILNKWIWLWNINFDLCLLSRSCSCFACLLSQCQSLGVIRT